MARAPQAVETPDLFEIRLEDDTVNMCRLDGIGLWISFLETGLEVHIEYPFDFAASGAKYRFDPEEPQEMGPLFGILRRQGAVVRAHKTGVLEIEIDGGYHLRVEPDGRYEPWGLVADNGLRIVAMPHGSLAVWDPIE